MTVALLGPLSENARLRRCCCVSVVVIRMGFSDRSLCWHGHGGGGGGGGLFKGLRHAVPCYDADSKNAREAAEYQGDDTAGGEPGKKGPGRAGPGRAVVVSSRRGVQ